MTTNFRFSFSLLFFTAKKLSECHERQQIFSDLSAQGASQPLTLSAINEVTANFRFSYSLLFVMAKKQSECHERQQIFSDLSAQGASHVANSGVQFLLFRCVNYSQASISAFPPLYATKGTTACPTRYYVT
ncbi:hypothetical protein OE749_09765 [Aestuariibacter sp. AA17]|uniref:Uncharacterized protein n=1 Tax=Fluctibacter corallii TaxID=2984329 RepID=A0ABT3A8H6_9ALTE|nr:hypothetical protein [Aestuariibacter sp. AA17]